MTLEVNSLVKLSSNLSILFYNRFVFKLCQSNMPVKKNAAIDSSNISMGLVCHPYMCVTIINLKEDKIFKNV